MRMLLFLKLKLVAETVNTWSVCSYQENLWQRQPWLRDTAEVINAQLQLPVNWLEATATFTLMYKKCRVFLQSIHSSSNLNFCCFSFQNGAQKMPSGRRFMSKLSSFIICDNMSCFNTREEREQSSFELSSLKITRWPEMPHIPASFILYLNWC